MSRDRMPGVYFESADPPPRSVTAVRTDIAGFVGVSERGPLHTSVKVESWLQFLTRFGDPIPEGFLAHAVHGFFANGGRTCWVVRVAHPPADAVRASTFLVNRAGRPVFTVRARDFGPGASRLSIRIETATAGRFSLLVRLGRQTLEAWRDLSPEWNDERGRFAVKRINGTIVVGETGPDFEERLYPGSVFIELQEILPAEDDRIPVGVRSAAVPEGPLGSASGVLAGLVLEDFTGEDLGPDDVRGLRALEAVDEVSLVAIPDLMWPGLKPPPSPPEQPRRCHVLTRTVPSVERPEAETRPPLATEEWERGQQAILRHCALTEDRFAVLDLPAGFSVESAVKWANERLRTDAGRNGALYFPWIVAEQSAPGLPPLLLPPSGHVCGMIARVDLSAGVQKPPANEILQQVLGVEREFDKLELGWLNDEGVNVIRPFPGRGVRVAGARTLVSFELPEWRYVNVRRLVLMLEESIDEASQWLVFEGNRPEKQRELDRVIRAFLDAQWRSGRLDGATADDAYQVLCNRTNNPPEEVEAGRLHCRITVRPPLPSEFVLVRVGRHADETAGLEGG